MRINKSKKEFKRGKRQFLEKEDWRGSVPEPEAVKNQSEYYNLKAFKDLQNVGSIEVKADPNSAIIRGSYPYYIIARTNRVADANYTGSPNIDGNILVRLQNSTESKLMYYYDVVSINLRLNYLYMCYNSKSKHKNYAVNNEFAKTIDEALSKGWSTMLTQLPFMTDEVELGDDIPLPSGVNSSSFNKLMVLCHYQAVMQNAFGVLAKYRQTMSLEQQCLNMTYRLEAPLITTLFGLLRKKAFVGTLNAMGTAVIGDYFDDNWFKQVNTISALASRKSNAITDPLLTATVTTLIPQIKLSTASVEYYDYADLSRSFNVIDPDTFIVSQETLTFEQMCYRLNRMLDVSTILTWARQVNNNSLEENAINAPSGYYQQINNLIEAINLSLVKFGSAMTNVRTFLDKMSNSGMIYWKKGIKANVDNVTPLDPDYNQLLSNIISVYLGTADKMIYDSNTLRWQATTLWNKYEGIPQFDRISGGSFITYGLRELEYSGSSTDIAMMVPVLFADELVSGSNKCFATDRVGNRVIITSDSSEGNINNNVTLSRLDALSTGFSVRVPSINLGTGLETSIAATRSSAALALLANLCGYGKVTVNNATESVCDPDYVCFIDVQIEDVSNEMITFARNYSPFRVMTPDGKRTIGFGKR